MVKKKKFRPFGVEIEFYVAVEPKKTKAYDEYHDEWYDNYAEDDALEEEFREFQKLLPMWEVKYDDSLEFSCEALGIEIASPVIRTPEEWSHITEATDILARKGAWTDDSCGLHVHHDISDFEDEDILRLVKSWSNNQEAIWPMVNESRYDSTYCSPWEEYEINELERALRNYGNIEHYGDKFKSLNISPRGYLGTIEIRQHHGTVDFQEISDWVNFTQSFVNSVSARKRVITKGDTESLLRRTKTRSIVRKRIMEKVG